MGRKVVVLAGARALWAQQQYLPVLLRAAIAGRVELWVTDISPILWPRRFLGLKLTILVTLEWFAAVLLGRAHYLRFSRDGAALRSHPAADLVFIVTGDPYHARVARYWSTHLREGGRVFIEKPLAATREQANEIKAELPGEGRVFGFTHFLARVYPFLKQQMEHADSGPIQALDLSIQESETVPSERMEPLRAGVINEIFPHILGVAGALILRRANLAGVALPPVEITSSIRFRLKGWTLPNESAASIEFRLGGVPISARMGKTLGKKDCKQMVIKREGQPDLCLPLYEPVPGLVDRRHVAAFLEAVLAGKRPGEIPGLVSFEAIYAMLEVSLAARDAAEWGSDYARGTSI